MFKRGQLLALLQLADSTLPIGGFSHSAGLETYVQSGLVTNSEQALEFITSMLTRNLRYTDGAFVSLAWDAAMQENLDVLNELDEECTAVKLPREIRQASQKLGQRLLKLFLPLVNDPILNQYTEKVKAGESMGHYSISFGIAAAALGIPKLEALVAFFYNQVVGMVTNSVKLIPLGQQAGQELLFSLHDLIDKTAQDSLIPDRDKIGLCCVGFDIRSMQHEQLYSRLYMS